jgi:hypothetical protein
VAAQVVASRAVLSSTELVLLVFIKECKKILWLFYSCSQMFFKKVTLVNTLVCLMALHFKSSHLASKVEIILIQIKIF